MQMKQVIIKSLFIPFLIFPLLLISQINRDIPKDFLDCDHLRQYLPQHTQSTTSQEWMKSISDFFAPYFLEKTSDSSPPSLLRSDLNTCFIILNPNQMCVMFIYKDGQKTEIVKKKITPTTKAVVENINKYSYTTFQKTGATTLKPVDLSEVWVAESFPDFSFIENSYIPFIGEKNAEQIVFLFNHSYYKDLALDMESTLRKNWTINTATYSITPEEIICLNFRFILQTFSSFVSAFDHFNFLEPEQETKSQTSSILFETIAYLKWFNTWGPSKKHPEYLSDDVLFHAIYVPLEYLLTIKAQTGPESSSSFVINQFLEKNWIHYSLLNNKYSIDFEKFFLEMQPYSLQIETEIKKGLSSKKKLKADSMQNKLK